MAYSLDLRKRVVQFVEEGGTRKEASQRFAVGIVSVYKWLKMKKTKGNIVDEKRKTIWRKIDPEKLKEMVKNHPEAPLKEHAKVFGVHGRSIGKVLKKMKFTRKKRQISTKNVTKKKEVYIWSN